MVKLNNKGFSYHLVLPILALFLVGSIGAFMTFRSNAAVPNEGWTTMRSASFTGAKMVKNTRLGLSNVSFVATSGVKYRVCAVLKSSPSGLPIRIALKPLSTGIAPSRLVKVTGSNATYCTYGSSLTSGKRYIIDLTTYSTPGTVYISKVFSQRYY